MPRGLMPSGREILPPRRQRFNEKTASLCKKFVKYCTAPWGAICAHS